jgi:hypothetical protein
MIDIEKLKTNEKPAGFLPEELRIELKRHAEKGNLIVYCGENHGWKPWGWHGIYDTQVYRLSPDFQLPIEPPEGYRIVSPEDRKLYKYPVDCEVMWHSKSSTFWMRSTSSCMWGSVDNIIFAVPSDYIFAEDRPKERWYFNCKHPEYGIHIDSDLEPWSDRFGWIGITEAEKKYLETKPEPVEGYDWVLKVPVKGELFYSMKHKGVRTAIGRPGININGIRWCCVPKATGWRDGWAQVNGQEIKAKVRVK